MGIQELIWLGVAYAMLAPMGIFGAALSLGGSSLSFLGDPLGTKSRKDANKANNDRWLQALAEIDGLTPQIEQSYAAGRRDMTKALETSKAGYKQAGGLLSAAASGSQLNAAQGAQKAAGGTQAGLLRSGLGGSSAAGNMQRGVLADLQRTQAGITQQSAGQQAGLTAQGAESASLILRQMSQQRALEAQALANWKRLKVDTIVGREDVAAPGWLGQVAGMAGSIAGAFGGGA